MGSSDPRERTAGGRGASSEGAGVGPLRFRKLRASGEGRGGNRKSKEYKIEVEGNQDGTKKFTKVHIICQESGRSATAAVIRLAERVC